MPAIIKEVGAMLFRGLLRYGDQSVATPLKSYPYLVVASYPYQLVASYPYLLVASYPYPLAAIYPQQLLYSPSTFKLCGRGLST